MSIINDDPNAQREADANRGIPQIVNAPAATPEVKKIEVEDGLTMPKEGLKPLHEQKHVDIDAALADDTPGTAHFDSTPAEDVDFSKYMESPVETSDSQDTPANEKDADTAIDFIETPIETKKNKKEPQKDDKQADSATKPKDETVVAMPVQKKTEREETMQDNDTQTENNEIEVNPEQAFDESNQELFGIIRARIGALRSERDELNKKIDSLEDSLIELQRKNARYNADEKFDLIDNKREGELLDEINKYTKDLYYKNRLISHLCSTISVL
jgi:hypothetical protein